MAISTRNAGRRGRRRREMISDGWATLAASRPLLTVARERELLAAAVAGRADDASADVKAAAKAARDELIESNLRYVIKQAARMQGLGVGLDDLISEGTLALAIAVDRWDGERTTRFLSYATHWIKRLYVDLFAAMAGVVRLPTHVWQGCYDGCGAKVKISADRRAKGQAALYAESLYSPEGEELLADHRTLEVESVETKLQNTRLIAALKMLDDRSRKLMEERYGLNGETARTLKNVGLTMGVSQERVRQIENRSIARLRAQLVEA